MAGVGVITVEPTRVLALFPTARIIVRDPAPVTALRDAVLADVRSDRAVSANRAALVALLDVGRLRSVLSGKERRANAARIDALTAQGAEAVPALRPVLRQIKAARAAAHGGGG